MIEVKVNIELGVNAEFKEFVTTLLSAPQVIARNANSPSTGAVEHLTKPRHRAAATTAPINSEDKVEQEVAPTEQAGQEQPKSAITLPDLRTEVKRLYDGCSHKEELLIIFSQFGVKNVTEVAEDKYQELYDVLTAKSEELGL